MTALINPYTLTIFLLHVAHDYPVLFLMMPNAINHVIKNIINISTAVKHFNSVQFVVMNCE